MSIDYDAATDSIYISLREGVARAFGSNLDDARYVDYGVDGEPIGIELLKVSRGVKMEGLPHAELVAQLLRQRHFALA